MHMKIMTKNLLLSFSIVALSAVAQAADQTPAPAAAAPTPASTNSSGPKIQFAESVYDFGKVSAGDPVKHEFVFTNTGNELLILTNVQPSCGCTTAGEWSHQVEPGKTGTIPVQFNSSAYNGPVTKTVTVTSNDKGQPTVVLQIKGTVWKPIDVQPQFVMLSVNAESQSNDTKLVHIVNNGDEPLTLSAPESNNKAFIAELVTNTPGKDYNLNISTVGPLDAGVQGQVSIKTSSTKTPVLNVTAWANVAPAVAFAPSVLSLPPAPLPGPLTNTVTIQNSGTNVLKLSDATVNAKGVEVQVQEAEPGRKFIATLTYPQGFEIAQGQEAHLSIKSNHPKYQEIRVPMVQSPRPQAVVSPIVPVPPAPPSTAATPGTKPAGQ
jgi:hypothetical protein